MFFYSLFPFLQVLWSSFQPGSQLSSVSPFRQTHSQVASCRTLLGPQRASRPESSASGSHMEKRLKKKRCLVVFPSLFCLSVATPLTDSNHLFLISHHSLFPIRIYFQSVSMICKVCLLLDKRKGSWKRRYCSSLHDCASKMPQRHFRFSCYG